MVPQTPPSLLILDEPVLRAKARALIQNGTLPSRPPDRKWGDRGNGARCVLCELPVTPEELKFEIHFDGPGSGLDMFHVHAPCFEALEFELGRCRSCNSRHQPAPSR